MNLQSEKTTVNKSAKELFELLSSTENFKNLLPSDIDGVEVFEDAIKVSLKGLPAIKLYYTEKTPFETIQLKVAGDAFPIFLTCKIKETENGKSEAQLFFDGEINMMMAMMIKGPLQDLLNTLSEKMSLL
jgi:carbon monoxide dehydrogenase subunit G